MKPLFYLTTNTACGLGMHIKHIAIMPCLSIASQSHVAMTILKLLSLRGVYKSLVDSLEIIVMGSAVSSRSISKNIELKYMKFLENL